MSAECVRFLHASQLELGAPLFGVGGLPYHLRSVMTNARFRAAERLFEAACSAEVDFVLFSGNMLSAGSGPRGCWFLAGQFERLAERGIPVYWFEEPAASSHWFDFVPLPSNVYLGDPQLGQVFEFHRGDRLLARIAAGTAAAPGEAAPGVRQIVALPEGLDGLPLSPVGVDYWALGGGSAAARVPSVCGVAEFAGTPQAYAPDETGPRGCVLVTIDEHNRCESRFLETNCVRWQQERVRVTEDMHWSELCHELLRRQDQVLQRAACDLVMLRWTLSGRGPLWEQLRRDSVCRQLLSLLIRHRRDSHPAAWSLVIDLAPDAEQLNLWSRGEGAFGELARVMHDSVRSAPAAAPPKPHFDRGAAQTAVLRLAESQSGESRRCRGD